MNVAFLLATLAAILAGPALYVMGRRSPRAAGALDGFSLCAIAGLVIIEVAPETLESGGLPSALFLFAGAAVPALVERRLAFAGNASHGGTLWLVAIGLCLHALADGAALAPHEGADTALRLAIIIHSVPVGIAVWWLQAPGRGWHAAAVATTLMCIATTLGYLAGPWLDVLIGARAWAWFQALIAGSVLHVIFDGPHVAPGRRFAPWTEVLGALLALSFLLLVTRLHTGGLTEQHGTATLAPTLDGLLGEAPAIAAAILLAAAVRQFALRPLAVASSGREPLTPPRPLDAPPPPIASALALAAAEPMTLLVTAALLGPRYALAVAAALLLAALAARLVASGATARSLPASIARSGRDEVERAVSALAVGLLGAALVHPIATRIDWPALPDPLELLAAASAAWLLRLRRLTLLPATAVLLQAGMCSAAGLALLAVAAVVGSYHPAAGAAARGRRAPRAACAAALAAAFIGGSFAALAVRPPLTAPDGVLRDLGLAALAALLASSLLRRGVRGVLSELR